MNRRPKHSRAPRGVDPETFADGDHQAAGIVLAHRLANDQAWSMGGSVGVAIRPRRAVSDPMSEPDSARRVRVGRRLDPTAVREA